MLLLDTCTLLWLAADPAHLSLRARKGIGVIDERLLVSANSACELGHKQPKGALTLPLPPERW